MYRGYNAQPSDPAFLLKPRDVLNINSNADIENIINIIYISNLHNTKLFLRDYCLFVAV